MKDFLAIGLMILVGTASMAQARSIKAWECKKPSEATGQGYEAYITGGNAELSLKGRKIANLVLGPIKLNKKGELIGDITFVQNKVNGYSLAMKKNRNDNSSRTVIVKRGGVAGQTEIARLFCL